MIISENQKFPYAESDLKTAISWSSDGETQKIFLECKHGRNKMLCPVISTYQNIAYSIKWLYALKSEYQYYPSVVWTQLRLGPMS